MDKKTLLRFGIGAVVLLAAGLIVLLRGGGEPPRPEDLPPAAIEDRRALVFEPGAVEFGEVQLGETRRLDVTVRNQGSAPVTVLREIVSCGCMTAAMAEKVVPPGGSQRLRVTFTGVPGKRSYDTSFVLVTDESGPSRYDLPAKGRVHLDLQLEPETAQFAKIPKGETREMEVLLRHVGGKPFKVVDIKTGRPEFSFSWEELPGGGVKIKAKARALRPGPVTDQAVVVTEPVYGAAPALIVAVEGMSELEFDPPIAVARVKRDGTLEPFGLNLKTKPGTSFTIKNVSEGRGLRAEFKVATVEERPSRLEISLPDGVPGGPPLGEFHVETSLDAEPIPLPYRIEHEPAKP